MTFKELKIGYPVYFFDRKAVKAFTGKVAMNPSISRADSKMSWQQMVVDVPIQFDDKTNTFVLPDNQDTAYPDGAVLSTNRDVILREIESMLTLNEQELAKVEERRDVAAKCKELLCSFNPAYREKQETDSRFEKMEKRIDDFGSKMDVLCQLVHKLTD